MECYFNVGKGYPLQIIYSSLHKMHKYDENMYFMTWLFLITIFNTQMKMETKDEYQNASSPC